MLLVAHMRLSTLPKLLLLGGAIALILGKRRSSRSARAGAPNVIPDSMDLDPADPVQGLGELAAMDLEELDLDAQVAAEFEIAQDLASIDYEAAIERDTPSQTDYDAIAGSITGDDGELYGVHTPRAVDRNLPDGDTSYDDGENWVEALQASAVENGAEPEREIDVVEDLFDPPPRSDTRDIPVADRGSGGPRGL